MPAGRRTEAVIRESIGGVARVVGVVVVAVQMLVVLLPSVSIIVSIIVGAIISAVPTVTAGSSAFAAWLPVPAPWGGGVVTIVASIGTIMAVIFGAMMAPGVAVGGVGAEAAAAEVATSPATSESATAGSRHRIWTGVFCR